MKSLYTILCGGSGRLTLHKAKLHAAQVFGGYSLSKVDGGWISPTGELVQETSWKWEVFTDLDTEVRAFAVYLRESFRQECVLVIKHRVEGEFI